MTGFLISGRGRNGATEARINALDLSTKQGQAAFKAELQNLERRATSGGFVGHEGEFGTFQGVQDLQGPLGEAADGLAALADATAQATRNLSNVPDLLTLSEQEFRARSAFGTNQGPNDGAELPITIGGPDRLRGVDFTPPIPAPGISESRIGLDATKVVDPITGREDL